MRKRTSDRISYAFILIFFIIVFIPLIVLSNKKVQLWIDGEQCNILPPGWIIVTDGKYFRFKYPDGKLGIHEEPTEYKAIERACNQSIFDNRNSIAENSRWIPIHDEGD